MNCDDIKNEDYKKLVKMIDECILRGSAHVNVSVGEEDKVRDESVCCAKGGACSVPTLHRGIDDDDETDDEEE